MKILPKIERVEENIGNRNRPKSTRAVDHEIQCTLASDWVIEKISQENDSSYIVSITNNHCRLKAKLLNPNYSFPDSYDKIIVVFKGELLFNGGKNSTKGGIPYILGVE